MFVANRFSHTQPSEALSEIPNELPILGKSLEEMQDWAIKLNGGEWSKDGLAQLWIRSDVYVSHQAVGLFLEAVKGSEEDLQWRAEGTAGNFAEEIALNDKTPLMVWCVAPCSVSIERFNSAKVVEVDVKTHPIAMPAPQDGVGVTLVSLPITDAVVLPMGHWSQTLWTNLLALAPYLWRELVGDNIITMIVRLAKAALFSFSTDPSKLIRRFVQKGKGCKIHPSAVVEGCILGDDVRIGANAVVRGCVLRDGVRIEELAIVEASVLSVGAVVQRQAMVKYSVLDEGAAVAGVVQLGVVGVNASVKRGAYLMDMNFGGPVQVKCDGESMNAPLGLIGCGIGEGAVIGLGVAVAAGRWIPQNIKVVMNPDHMLRSLTLPKIESSNSELYSIHKGKLRGLDVG